jgi:3-phytase
VAAATDVLGAAWDDSRTMPSLEMHDDLPSVAVNPLPKTLLVDLEALDVKVPDKIEGVAVLDIATKTVAVINDNDFDVAGNTTPSQLLIIRIPPPS